ncbi:MAG: CotH kinase family protein [Balneolales bacterium]
MKIFTIYSLLFIHFFGGMVSGFQAKASPRESIVDQQAFESPVFSHQPGFYMEAFELSIHHSDPDANIHYTQDGSEPTPDSPIYSTPIFIQDRSNEVNDISEIPTSSTKTYWTKPRNTVKKSTVIRAKAIKSDGDNSNISTGTYFIDQEGDDRYTLPVFSISTNRDHLFSDDNGIYVYGESKQGNFRQSGREWERPANIEMFDEDGELYLNQLAGVRIHGGGTRIYGQKSLRLYARSEYGENRFYQQLFSNQLYDEYKRLLLRNSGNDWQTTSTMFRDAVAQSLIGNFNVDTQAYRPVIVFINGEYWGIHNLRERYDRHYLARVYGVDSNIDLISGQKEVKEGDIHHYNQMIDFLLQNDLSEEAEFNKVDELMDIDNFLDYYSAQIYYGNPDWPHNNIEFWRLRAPYSSTSLKGHDGRWRWLLFDVDYAMGLYTNNFNVINRIADNSRWHATIVTNLLDNEQFKNRFINRIADHLNSAFTTNRVVLYIDSLGRALKPEMNEHLQRWNRLDSVEEWEANVEKMKEFAHVRPDIVRQHILDHFNIEKAIKLEVNISDPSAGSVRVNSMEISVDTPGIMPDLWPWDGIYFQNIPVTLEAEALPGYAFSHWEGLEVEELKSPKITLSIADSAHVQAVFKSVEIEPFPEPFVLNDSTYTFSNWTGQEPAATYPDHMAFVYMDEPDPGLGAGIESFTQGVYNLESRTRINGLGENGFAFINTGSEEGNPGYPGTRLGGALLALDTRDLNKVEVSWKGMTVLPNSRVYNMRLQYRVGNQEPFRDVMNSDGNPVEYLRNEVPGHTETIGPVVLPSDANNEPYVQLLWRYYFTGLRLDEDSGQRTNLSVANIKVGASIDDDIPVEPDEIILKQNYPNPFNTGTVIGYELPTDNNVRIEIFDVIGQKIVTLLDRNVSAGLHEITFDASGLSSGVYLYRLQADGLVQTRQMLLIK